MSWKCVKVQLPGDFQYTNVCQEWFLQVWMPSCVVLCRDEYYSWGLLQIAKAVSFLNNDCKLVRVLFVLHHLFQISRPRDLGK